MGLGSTLKRALGVAAPILSVLPTPIAPLARAVTATGILNRPQPAQSPLIAPQFADLMGMAGSIMPAGLMSGAPVGPGGVTPTANPVVSGVIKGAQVFGRWLVGARGLAYSAAGRLVGVMRGTTLFSNKKVLRMARLIGIEATAVALGITAADVASMIVAESAKPARRARGISGRDVRITRRTIGKIRGIEKGLRESGICRRR